ncbi:hypothetical protein F5Y16DRAFT_47703 [Xylariaceae sp. FL0255]|nr:hypothetical protein F5Y16DRAFT_47703 [Xylariaceae sp. FL0255]
MNEEHLSTPIGPRGTLRARPPPLRSKSPSPVRHRLGSDDLLSRLKPASVVEAFQSPSGSLRACLEQATASEYAFAMRIAVASKTINGWLGELSSWTWPSTASSAGFEMPSGKGRKSSGTETTKDSHEAGPHSNTKYLGCLPADDVLRYETRLEQIHQDMEGLDLEEIKTQVLHNHILPLSRPGTPFSDAGRSVMSTFSFARMEDLTAVVTAITVQTLPALSRLTRLLQLWGVRLIVLRKSPVLLMMITDAEVALLSGWNAIESPVQTPSTSGNESSATRLSKKDFDVMNSVIQQKVARPGRHLDHLLDVMEGMPDTLPEEWIDRMEAIERDYAEWSITAERKVREGEHSNLAQPVIREIPPEQLKTPQPKIQVQCASPTKKFTAIIGKEASHIPEAPLESLPIKGDSSSDPESQPNEGPIEQSSKPSFRKITSSSAIEKIKSKPGSRPRIADVPKRATTQHTISSTAKVRGNSQELSHHHTHETKSSKPQPRSSSSRDPPARKDEAQAPRYDGSEDSYSTSTGKFRAPVLKEVNRNIVRQPLLESSNHHDEAVLKPAYDDDFEPSILESVNEEEEELELPQLPVARKSSQSSIRSADLQVSLNCPPENSDDGSFRAGSLEPELPRLPDPNEPFSSDAISPPSSPPLRFKPRSTSVTFKDVPEIALLPKAHTSPPDTPHETPSLFDPDVSFEWESQLNSPSRMSTISTVSDDDHLQKQLRELLETIPAKIELKRGINLNPPDLQLPGRPKPRPSDSRRPTSALSSRAGSRAGTPFSRSGTPSFMLAPVRDNRPRSTSSQAIRAYHLSRSGETPIKLFIRCVGENNERVMVRVGGGWSDLGEYLRDYATHHGSRSKGEGKVEVTNTPPAVTGRTGSSPTSRPGSALEGPMTPLAVRKTRKSLGEDGATKLPRTPIAQKQSTEDSADTPASEASVHSRASSQVIDWDEEDSSLGLAGPKAAKRREISDESRAWVESMKEKVRSVSGERIGTLASLSSEQLQQQQFRSSTSSQQQFRASTGSQRSGPQPLKKPIAEDTFGDLGKVGGTKRLFRKN